MATFKRATMNQPKADTGDVRPNNPLQSDFDAEDSGSSVDADERYLSLHRQWKFFESFAASFAALYSVGGIRTTFTIGVGAGGPAAYW
ncbi:hypothetical protein KC352_g29146 [Hortaea werneckii]|nr:hypothetical protein KC352_g29146 [Hortaea werneckii]